MATPSDADSSREAIQEDLHCPDCGYSLRGLEERRCPECGLPFDPAELAKSSIPWSYRHQIGRLRAYWRTVWMATFNHKRLSQEIHRPVSYRDSQRFRLATILFFYLLVVLATIAAYVKYGIGGLGSLVLDEAARMVWPAIAIHVGVILFLAAATGLPSYFFHPRRMDVVRQNRAIALSYYGSAALAWTPLTVAVFFVGSYLHGHKIIYGEAVLWLAAFVLTAQLFMWWFGIVRLAGRTLDRSFGGVIAFGVVLPIGWSLLGVLTLIGVPAIAFYVYLVVASLSS
jgi:hypothetical protein